MTPLPPELEHEREELIREIYAAFAGVSREGGVSWSERAVRNGGGPPEEGWAARALDKDRAWTELVDDPAWDPTVGITGYNFLDSIGMRYYLPAGMLRCIRAGRDAALAFHMVRRPVLWASQLFDSVFKLLDAPQRRCVARFVWYMLCVADFGADDSEWRDWSAAWSSYWANAR